MPQYILYPLAGLGLITLILIALALLAAWAGEPTEEQKREWSQK